MSESSIPLKTESPFTAATTQETLVLSIEQLNLQIKQLLEGQMNSVWIKGEISNFKAHTSGHYYFSLKDSKSQISAVMFRGHNSRLKFKLSDGLEVIAKGRISVYEPRGSYQILVETMEPVGAGALQRAFEELKLRLKNEGLFDSKRKRTIPVLPKRIAIVTSPTGAAIQDMMNIIKRRAPYLEVYLVPTLVQGDGAAPQILEALKKAWRIKDIDVIILGRGGGSIEDMWCFNDETLARTIAQSPIPVISAVGHEIDFTISDFVADLRAPTPSAAAELVAKSSKDLGDRLKNLNRMLDLVFERKLKQLMQRLEYFRLKLVDPKQKLQDLSLRNDDLLNRLNTAFQKKQVSLNHRVQILIQKLKSPEMKINRSRDELLFLKQKMDNQILKVLEKKKSKIEKNMAMLDSLSPLKVVDRGYAIISIQPNGEILKSAKQIAENQNWNVRLAEGQVSVKVTEVKI